MLFEIPPILLLGKLITYGFSINFKLRRILRLPKYPIHFLFLVGGVYYPSLAVSPKDVRVWGWETADLELEALAPGLPDRVTLPAP